MVLLLCTFLFGKEINVIPSQEHFSQTLSKDVGLKIRHQAGIMLSGVCVCVSGKLFAAEQFLCSLFPYGRSV
jgi:hypothetical protein